jgi:PPOX class probable F420-dependent enzyme
VNEAEARRRFARARVARLATIRPDGRPHVVPFVFVADGDTCYWAVDAKPKSSARIARLVNIERNPAVEAVVDAYDEDWRSLWWVRAEGRARTIGDEAERRAALEMLAGKYPQYVHDRPAAAVVAIDVERWAWWEAVAGGASASARVQPRGTGSESS